MRAGTCGVLVVAALGCAEGTPVPLPEQGDPPAPVNRFEADAAGTIRGRVTWTGNLPTMQPGDFLPSLNLMTVASNRLLQDNPNAPIVDSQTRGVRHAVIFLRGVEPERARPWDHRPVTIEQRDFQFRVRQGDAAGRAGFVRRGDAVEMVSRQAVFHSVSASGAAFFTLAFPDPDQPLKRRLERNGVVELSSAAGHFWMRAYLFVDEHPYYACTNAAGGFELAGVPPGAYEVVCWLPSWREARHERDPETGDVLRFFFRPPVVQTRAVHVGPREVREVGFAYGDAMFRTPP